MNSVLFYLLTLSLAACSSVTLAPQNALHPFTSDGCSLSPDGTDEKPKGFLKCCVNHDLAYWQGGTHEQKEAADLALKSCISDNSNASTGMLYWQGVRLGGGPQFKTSFRWGYGWREHHSYTPLTPEQQTSVDAEIKAIDWDLIYKLLE